MSIIGFVLNLVLVGLLLAALALGLRLNRRLKVLRDSHDGFARAVQQLNMAAARAEQGLADLRAATDEATDTLADRIERGRVLAQKLERLLDQSPARAAAVVPDTETMEHRFGALLAAAREARPRVLPPLRQEAASRPMPPRRPPEPDDDLFDEAPRHRHAGVRR